MKIRVLLFVLCLFNLTSYGQKISFLLDDFEADRWRLDSSIFYNKATELGAEVFVYHANANAELQIAQAKKSIDSLKCDALVLVSVDKEKSKEILKYANKEKVPVILYDREVKGVYSKFLTFDNYQIGRLQAEHILAQKNVKNILLVNGPKLDNNAVLHRKGQLDVLKPYIDNGQIKVLLDTHLTGWTEFETYFMMTDYMSASNDTIDAVIAGNDGLAKGVSDVLEIYGYDFVPITGQDGTTKALESVKGLRQSFTVIKPTDLLANKAAEEAVKLSRDNKNRRNKDVQYIDVISINRKNVNVYLETKN